MNEVDSFVSFQKYLLGRGIVSERTRRGSGCKFEGNEASRRVGVVLRQLLLLGVELRAELPDPEGFVHAAASAAIEAALLVAPEGSAAEGAIDYLRQLQTDRLRPGGDEGTPGWQGFTAEMHLMRAFWQLTGLGLEVILGGFRDGQVEEHAADLANYLVFATWTSGAWELAFAQGWPEPPPSYRFPGPGIRRGRQPRKENVDDSTAQ